MTLPNENDTPRHGTACETVFENLGDGMLVLDRRLRVTQANRWIEKRYSGTEPLVGQKCHAALYRRDQPCPACPALRTLQTGKPQSQIAKVAAGPGRVLWFEFITFPLLTGEGETVGVVEQVKDITKLRLAEDRLRDLAALRHIFIDESRDGIVVLRPDGAVREANLQFALMLGLTMDELLASRVWDWDPQWDKTRLLSMLERSEVTGESFEMRFQRESAPPIHVEIASVGAVSSGERLIYWCCRDITGTKALQEEIRQLGIHDPLTGLYNRRYVLERLTEAAAEYLRGGSEFCISIIDLDHFRTVNDVHGPKAADLALEEFADIIGATVRPYDLVGRFGGDEFIIVSRNAGQNEADAMLRRIFGAVRGRDLSFEGHMMRLTFSCGLVCCGGFPADALSIDAMIARAYEHLEAAKSAGGDRSVSGLSPEAAVASADGG